MFTGIFTKILIGLIGALIISNAATYLKYNWWDRPRYEKEIRELQEAGIKAQAKIYKQAAEIKDLEAAKKIRGVQTRENQEIDQVVSSGDDARMRDVFVGLGMLLPVKGGPPQPGQRSIP